MAKTQKLTREEKAAAAQAERTAKWVADFKARQERARGRRLYSERDAWDATCAGVAPKGARIYDATGALWEMMREWKDATADIRRKIQYAQERLTESLARMDRGERAAYYSDGILSGQLELERQEQRAWTLAEAVIRLAYATNWYVPDVHPQRERDRIDLLRRVTAVRTAGGEWILRRDDDDATRWFDGAAMKWVSTAEIDEERGRETAYADELSALRAFAALVGDRAE